MTPKQPRRTARFETGSVHKLVAGIQRGQNEVIVAPGGKLPLRATYTAVGQLFYRVGTQTEYAFIRFGRGARAAARFSARAAAALLAFVGGPLLALFSSIWDDLTAPLRRFVSGVRHALDAARAERAFGTGRAAGAGLAYLKNGVRAYSHLIAPALRYLMPAAALAVLCFTVHEILSSSFSLSVEYNGKTVLVENEAVWDTAEQMVQARVKSAEGDTVEWDAHPIFTLSLADPSKRTNAGDLADTIIEASSEQIREASGIYVNGELIGVVEDGAAIQQLLSDTLAAYDDGTHLRVGFLYPIDLVPGVYFTSSVQDTTMMQQALQSSDVLSVAVTDRVEYDEAIPYTDEEVESDSYVEGTRFVSRRGRDGVQHIVAEVTTVNGVETARTILETTVTQEMVPRVYTVGTRPRSYGVSTAPAGSVVGSGSMVFPVTQLKYITTRYGQGWPPHRGVDLCAPAGSPILAADSGTVVEAGSHWSFGNYLLIDHGNGITTRYAHCSALLVGAGSTVTAGQQIATVGSTGYSSGYHLHFEVTVNGALVNPQGFLGYS